VAIEGNRCQSIANPSKYHGAQTAPNSPASSVSSTLVGQAETKPEPSASWQRRSSRTSSLARAARLAFPLAAYPSARPESRCPTKWPRSVRVGVFGSG
jgi:hypothetical protein